MRGIRSAPAWLPVLIDQLHARPDLRDAAPLADVLDHATRDNA